MDLLGRDAGCDRSWMRHPGVQDLLRRLPDATPLPAAAGPRFPHRPSQRQSARACGGAGRGARSAPRSAVEQPRARRPSPARAQTSTDPPSPATSTCPCRRSGPTPSTSTPSSASTTAAPPSAARTSSTLTVSSRLLRAQPESSSPLSSPVMTRAHHLRSYLRGMSSTSHEQHGRLVRDPHPGPARRRWSTWFDGLTLSHDQTAPPSCADASPTRRRSTACCTSSATSGCHSSQSPEPNQARTPERPLDRPSHPLTHSSRSPR